MTEIRDTQDEPPGLRLGLRQNLGQFSLLVGVNALVGGMIGQERTVLPLLADQAFGLTAFTATLTFIAAFGIVKAATNFFAGTLSDRVRTQAGAGRRLDHRPARPAHAHVGPHLGLGHRRQRAARHQPGPHLVHHRHHEDRPRRPRAARVRHGPQRGRRLRRGRRHRPGHRAHRRAVRAPSRAVLPGPRLRRPRPRASRPCSCGDPRPRPARGRHPHRPARPPPRRAHHRTDLHAHQLHGEGACPRAARPGSSTTSTTDWPGACSPSSSPSAGLSVARIGVLAAIYPAVWGLGPAHHRRPVGPHRPQAPHRRRHAHPGRRHRLDRRHHRVLGLGRSGRSCSAPAPPWCTPPCWPPSATWPTRPGGPGRSASTGCGATAASPSAPSSPASWPTPSHPRRPSGPWPRSPPLSGLVVAGRMYETHPRPEAAAPLAR